MKISDILSSPSRIQGKERFMQNENRMLTNPRSGLPTYGHLNNNRLTPGNTYEESLTWFDSPTDFEYEHQSRGFYHRDHIPFALKQYILEEELRRFNKTIERLVIQRCLPGPYKKEVGWNFPLVVGVVDGELWHLWVASHSSPPKCNKEYRHMYPDHAGPRSEIFYQVGWDDGLHYPDLATPNWYFTKWYCDGIVHRGVVNKIFFYTESVFRPSAGTIHLWYTPLW